MALLCAAYLQGGIVKLWDFQGAIAEQIHFDIPVPTLAAAAVILTELLGSILVISGILRWAGALWLAGFTLVANFLANAYWTMAAGPDRWIAANGFYEHFGLIGGFVLIAVHDLRRARL